MNYNLRWSSGMSRMSGIYVSRYIQLWCAVPFVSYCFQLDKIYYILGTLSPILMGFSAKQRSPFALPNKLKNWNLIGPDIRLISLDRITMCVSSRILKIMQCDRILVSIRINHNLCDTSMITSVSYFRAMVLVHYQYMNFCLSWRISTMRSWWRNGCKYSGTFLCSYSLNTVQYNNAFCCILCDYTHLILSLLCSRSVCLWSMCNRLELELVLWWLI